MRLLNNFACSYLYDFDCASFKVLKKLKFTPQVNETQKRLNLALKPSQFPDLLTYIVIGLLGWLFAKFVI